ncbi:MAG TPA: type II secretion system protein [Planctomycetaceae bacterium]|nr:type II secretion system protein [Planctomycetaceae bacterium]
MGRNDRRHAGSVVARRGVVLLAALVCVGIAGAVLVSTLRSAISQRRSLQARFCRVQAAWLAESALERAAWQLAADPDYRGEVWKVPAQSLGGNLPATVTIQVEPVPDSPDARMVRVRADCPDDPVHRARFSKQLTISVRPSDQGDKR